MEKKGFWSRLNSIFRKSPAESENAEDEVVEVTLEDKIDRAIDQCLTDKNAALDEKEQLRGWAIEAIQEVFEIPHKFWYKELEEYETIKALESNQKVGRQVRQKCDKIVAGYEKQIALQDSKIALCETLIAQYAQTQKKLQHTREQIVRDQREQEQLKKLEKHSRRLREMDDDTSELEFSYESSENLKLIESDLRSVEQDFEIQEDFHRQMNRINQEISEDKSFDYSEVYKGEMEKIIQNIKKHPKK